MKNKFTIYSKLITAILISIYISGCISLNDKIEVIYAPQLEISFSKLTAPVKLNDAKIFIFNSGDTLIEQKTLTIEHLASAEPLQIIKGVPDGEYRMVAFYNVANMKFPELTNKFATTRELFASLDSVRNPILPTQFIYDNLKDSICFSNDRFVLERGLEKTTINSNVTHAHFTYNFSIEGLDKVTGKLGVISLKLLNLPSGLDTELMPRNIRVNHNVELQNNTDNTNPVEKIGKYMSLSYTYDDNVQLKLLEDGLTMKTITLDPDKYITESSKNHLDIRIIFEVDTFSIVVNNWILKYDYVSMGG